MVCCSVMGLKRNCCLLGIIQNCHHFHKSIQNTLGGGSMATVCFFLMLIMMHFHTGVVKNHHFQSILFGGSEGVTKMSTLCTLLIMLAIMDDPLTIRLVNDDAVYIKYIILCVIK